MTLQIPMITPFCSWCGLKVETPTALLGGESLLHAHCVGAWTADKAANLRTPKTATQRQLDRIESELSHVRRLIVAMTGPTK